MSPQFFFVLRLVSVWVVCGCVGLTCVCVGGREFSLNIKNIGGWGLGFCDIYLLIVDFSTLYSISVRYKQVTTA